MLTIFHGRLQSWIPPIDTLHKYATGTYNYSPGCTVHLYGMFHHLCCPSRNKTTKAMTIVSHVTCDSMAHQTLISPSPLALFSLESFMTDLHLQMPNEQFVVRKWLSKSVMVGHNDFHMPSKWYSLANCRCVEVLTTIFLFHCLW